MKKNAMKHEEFGCVSLSVNFPRSNMEQTTHTNVSYN